MTSVSRETPLTYAERTAIAEDHLRAGYDPERETGARRTDAWGAAQKWRDEMVEEAHRGS